jgi:hypothetical protein
MEELADAIERLTDHLGEDAVGTMHNVSAADVATVVAAARSLIRRCIDCDRLIEGDDFTVDGMLYVHPSCYAAREP